MRNDSPTPDPVAVQGRSAPDAAIDDLFSKINHDFRWPKPSEEAVATALHAIQRLAADVGLEGEGSSGAMKTGGGCPNCGAANAATNRFCGSCGSRLDPRDKQERHAPDQHIYHHHSHYHYFESGRTNSRITVDELAADSAASIHDPDPISDVSKLPGQWTAHWKAGRLDEIMELYSSEAIVLHPNSTAARGRAAIRQLLQELIESGPREIELTGSDTGLLGKIACLTTNCKMIVPLLTGGSREETGKHLLVARLEAGKWRILAHAWSFDTAGQQPSTKVTPISPSVLSK